MCCRKSKLESSQTNTLDEINKLNNLLLVIEEIKEQILISPTLPFHVDNRAQTQTILSYSSWTAKERHTQKNYTFYKDNTINTDMITCITKKV